VPLSEIKAALPEINPLDKGATIHGLFAELASVQPLAANVVPNSKPPAPAGLIKTVWVFPFDVNITSDVNVRTINRKKFFIVKTLSNIANI
jgi:hypothetical protein